MLSLERLLFDPSAASDGPLMGAYVISSSGDVIDATDVGGTKGLDVNVLNDIDVGLDHANDSVRVGDGTNLVTVTNVASDYGLDVNLINASIAVTQSGSWDIGTLTGITNDVNIADGGNSITVDALNLDIRDLTHASDSVKVGDGTDFLAINSDGSILAQESPYNTIECGAITVGVTEVLLPASPLSNRKSVMVQNNGTKPIFLGPTGLSVADGIEVSKGGTFEARLGASAALYAISGTAGQDVRVFEMAA